jgi:hypothetical protein
LIRKVRPIERPLYICPWLKSLDGRQQTLLLLYYLVILSLLIKRKMRIIPAKARNRTPISTGCSAAKGTKVSKAASVLPWPTLAITTNFSYHDKTWAEF